MSTTKELLAEYNRLMPHKPLKEWKGSKAVLQAKINAMVGKVAASAAKKDDGIDVPKSGNIKIRTAAEWARELGKNPKVVRAKLRKSGLSTNDGWGTIVKGSVAYKVIAGIKTSNK